MFLFREIQHASKLLELVLRDSLTLKSAEYYFNGKFSVIFTPYSFASLNLTSPLNVSALMYVRDDLTNSKLREGLTNNIRLCTLKEINFAYFAVNKEFRSTAKFNSRKLFYF